MGGVQLLALLQTAARCGVPIVQSCMQRLLWHCNQVLFKQLTSWYVAALYVGLIVACSLLV